jgi:hypothetical protein
VRDGDHDALAGLCARRGPAVLAYCQRVAGEEQAVAVAAEAFRRFRAAVVAADDLTGLNPEALLISATREAAVSRIPRPADQPQALRFAPRRPATGWCGDTPALLAARANRRISTIDRARLEQHLLGCPACRAPLARFEAAERVYRDPPDEPLPLPASAAIMAALAAAAPVTTREATANAALAGDVTAPRRTPLTHGTVPAAASAPTKSLEPDGEFAPASPSQTRPAGLAPELPPAGPPAPATPPVRTPPPMDVEEQTAAPTGHPEPTAPETPVQPHRPAVAASAVSPETPASELARSAAPPSAAAPEPAPAVSYSEPYDTEMAPAEQGMTERDRTSEAQAGPARQKVATALLGALRSLPSLSSLRLRRPPRPPRPPRKARPPRPPTTPGTQEIILSRPQAPAGTSARASSSVLARLRPAALLPIVLIVLAIVVALAIAGVFGGGDDAASTPSTSSGTGTTPDVVISPGADTSAAAVEAAKARARATARRAARRPSESSSSGTTGSPALPGSSTAPTPAPGPTPLAKTTTTPAPKTTTATPPKTTTTPAPP